ncbi:MAG TPA: hypothetical protein P5230_03515 [Candidatus Magasanikbacteria bacterium]|nr:hypothetical protein [Candidatus Magasanikbacteria bacterium]
MKEKNKEINWLSVFKVVSNTLLGSNIIPWVLIIVFDGRVIGFKGTLVWFIVSFGIILIMILVALVVIYSKFFKKS